MNLKVQLLYRILLIAVICLMASTSYVLYQTDKQAKLEASFTANLVEKQVREQLLNMFSHNDFSSSFPNTELWPDINGVSGSCIQFLSRSEKRRRNICNQTDEAERTWPAWFGTLYQHFFSPDFEVKKDISFNAMAYGSILVTLNTRIETARAWNNLRAIIGVLFASIFTVCILVYFTINRLLKPAQIIITGLERMGDGDLNTHLPSFNIKEWKLTSEAINQLARRQQLIMADNKQLVLKLMNIQEEEHRYIARELHDEFGQCLAGINAITTSINQTASTHCPDILDETGRIHHITSHMMGILHNMLTRLRPAEVDEIGLTASINKLISSWNTRSSSHTKYTLTIKGECDKFPEPLPVNLYRIIQECLTNISKHAQASQAEVMLTHQEKNIHLIITDNGIAETDSFDNTAGVGLLGIRERVIALGGQLQLSSPEDNGLTININIPY